MLKKISFAIAASALFFSVATAASAAPLSGWAWSSNIGWISFNSGDGATASLSTTTGAFGGYAWSPNIGWVSFNPSETAGCPVGSCAPSVNLSTGAVSGWARALAGVGRTDGWDGWIELSGANHGTDATGNGGVTYVPSTGKFVGYAWGSNVVGWLSFNTGSGGGPGVCVGSTGCGGPDNPPPTVTVSCLVTGSQTVDSNVPFKINSSATGGGGSSNSYDYVWSVGGNGLFYPPSHVYTIINTTSTAEPYTVYVEATSGTGTSSATSCGTVTVNGTGNASVTAPTLWIGSTLPGVTQTSIRQGSNATVGYSIPSGVTCTAYQNDNGAAALSDWSGPRTLTGSATFTNMQLGVYNLVLDGCLSGSSNNYQPVPNSNGVEIDVTPSSVKEQ